MILILLESHGLVKNCAAINTFNLYSIVYMTSHSNMQNKMTMISKIRKILTKKAIQPAIPPSILAFFKAKSNAKEAVKPIQYMSINSYSYRPQLYRKPHGSSDLVKRGHAWHDQTSLDLGDIALVGADPLR